MDPKARKCRRFDVAKNNNSTRLSSGNETNLSEEEQLQKGYYANLSSALLQQRKKDNYFACNKPAREKQIQGTGPSEGSHAHSQTQKFNTYNGSLMT